MLKIDNLTAAADNQIILDKINLKIKQGEVHVLLGPNGSGKSSLAQVIMGNPHYQIKSGQIFFQDRDITQLPMEKRVELGLALAYQDPPEIKGVPLQQLLDLIGSKQPNRAESARQPKWTKKLLKREVNVKFSGGEKKIAEILQVLALNPKLAIFDELDSGLDVKNMARVISLVKSEIIDRRISSLFITHYGKIVSQLEPDWTHVMLNKKIICSSQDYQQVITTINQHGYQRCRQCQSLDS